MDCVAKSETLEEVLQIIDDCKKKPKLAIPSYYCGGSLTIDAKASSSEEMDFSILANEASKQSNFQAEGQLKVLGYVLDMTIKIFIGQNFDIIGMDSTLVSRGLLKY